MTGALSVAAGGALGAVARYLVYEAIERDSPIPGATLAVNVAGSFALGVLLFGGATAETHLLFGVGACGSFTTFATFSVETVDAAAAGRYRVAAGNAAVNLLGALAAIGLAWLLVAVLGSLTA